MSPGMRIIMRWAWGHVRKLPKRASQAGLLSCNKWLDSQLVMSLGCPLCRWRIPPIFCIWVTRAAFLGYQWLYRKCSFWEEWFENQLFSLPFIVFSFIGLLDFLTSDPKVLMYLLYACRQMKSFANCWVFFGGWWWCPVAQNISSLSAGAANLITSRTALWPMGNTSGPYLFSYLLIPMYRSLPF